MLKGDRTLENIEVKTSRPLSSFGDRSYNEDEENVARSESSSGGSSPSDLRRRLQRHPSPNEATRLANRVINISRRLSRKRDFCFHGATDRIEENVEKEEKEEQEISKRPLGDSKERDARARRRAKIRLESMRNRAMVVSKPSDTTASDLRSDSSDNQASARSLLIRDKIEEVPEENSEQSLLGVEMQTNNTQRYSSLSGRLPSTSSLYRSQQDETNNDSSRSQRSSAFLHPYSNRSSENSPTDRKDRVELQAFSPVSSKSVSCNKYRPCRGVILQNLSSGSDPDSSYEIISDRIGSNQKIDRLIAVTPEESNISSRLCGNSLETQNLNDSLPSISSSSRRSSNHTLVNSSRKDYSENNVSSPVTRLNFMDRKYRQGVNPLRLTSLSPLRKVSPEKCFYRTLNSSRSDCSRNIKAGLTKGVEEPLFFSAREEVRDYNRERLETPPALFGSSAYSNITSRVLETGISRSLSRDVVDPEKNVYNENVRQSCERILDQKDQEVATKVHHSSSSLRSRVSENQTFVSTPGNLRSPESASKRQMFEDRPDSRSEFYSSGIADTNALKQAISKCILDYDSSNDVKFTPTSQFKACTSENQSAASSCSEFCIGDFTKLHEENFYSPQSIKNDEEVRSSHSNETVHGKEFVSVPTLVLNSREMSYSTSPGSKVSSEKRLDANTLIVALSNASLKQQTTKDTSENNCSEFRADSRTVSRQESSENNLSMDNRFGPNSKSDETQSRLTTSRTSCRSSISTRSKIPVKIPTNRSRLSVASKFNEAERRVPSHRTSPIDSNRQVFRSNPSSPEGAHFGSDRSNEVSGSRESSPLIKNYVDTGSGKSAKVVTGSLANTDSKEQGNYTGSKCITDESENVKNSDVMLRDVRSRSYLSLQISDDDDRCENKESGQNQKYAAGRDEANYDESSIDRHAVGDTFRSPNFSDGSKKSKKTDKQNSPEYSTFSESESDSSSSHGYDIRDSVKKPEEPEECEEPESFFPRIASIDSQLENYPSKHFNAVYEGEIFEKDTEKEEDTNLFENQIGDGAGQQILVEDSKKLKFEGTSLNSTPEDEELVKVNRIAENRERLRFSLEQLAVEQFRKSVCTEQTKVIQSDTVAFFTERFCEVPQFSLACSSSTSKLRHDKSRDSPRFKKKSQDRFPFTISEKTSIASMKFKVPARLGNLDEEDMEDRGYKLDTHPSITRLAGSGFEDSPAEIISYVAQTELEDRYVKSSGMMGLVKKFSARWKKSKRCDEAAEPNTKMTSVIYKNRDYQEEFDSSIDSCSSESSLLKEFQIYESTEEKLCKIEANPDSPDEKSSIIYDKDSSNKENSKNTPVIAENPCRRYDRDDLWVQAFKDFDSDREEQKENVETFKKVDESKSKDPYSVFFVKNARETPETTSGAFLTEDDKKKQEVSTKKQKNRVKFRGSSLVVAAKRTNESVHREPIKNRNSERIKRNRNRQTGCFCLRFYRMIASISFGWISKYRSGTNYNSSSIKKKSRVSLHKKKG